MHSMTRAALTGIVLALFFVAGCQEEEATAPATRNTGVVEANRTYLDNFGVPPQGKAGEAFARVCYLPLRDSPEKVRAIPLFLFSKKDELRQILERLVSGELEFPANFGLYNPFPDDLKVTASLPESSTVNLSLSSQQSWSVDDMEAAGLALAETVFQDDQVKHVFITLNGQPLPQMPAEGYRHSEARLDKIKPPGLVLMAGMWEKGTDNLDELLVEFDRPITVNKFKLYTNSGTTVDGEYFTSIFQMAVVVLPKEPGLYREGTILRAEWDVTDGLGRSNSGSTTMPLRRYEH